MERCTMQREGLGIDYSVGYDWKGKAESERERQRGGGGRGPKATFRRKVG